MLSAIARANGESGRTPRMFMIKWLMKSRTDASFSRT